MTFPINYITQRYERLGWSPRAGTQTKGALLAKGLCSFEAVRTPTARVKILRLTDQGREYLRDQGIKLPRQRQGGTVHEYWRHIISETLRRQAYTVTLRHLSVKARP